MARRNRTTRNTRRPQASKRRRAEDAKAGALAHAARAPKAGAR